MQSIMRDLFLPNISATEFDTNPDAMKEISHASSEKNNVTLNCTKPVQEVVLTDPIGILICDHKIMRP